MSTFSDVSFVPVTFPHVHIAEFRMPFPFVGSLVAEPIDASSLQVIQIAQTCPARSNTPRDIGGNNCTFVE